LRGQTVIVKDAISIVLASEKHTDALGNFQHALVLDANVPQGRETLSIADVSEPIYMLRPVEAIAIMKV
jgi:hypothetical protein